MEEGAKVRLVRCPKCENVLPELPNLAVYKCGGCGAVLQAKKQPNSSGGSPERSDDEGVGVNSEKVESFAEKVEGEGLSDDASEVSSNRFKFSQRRRERGLVNGTAGSNSSSSAKVENKIVDENIGMAKHDGRNGGMYRRPASDHGDAWGLGSDHEMNRNREKSVSANMERGVGGNDPQMGIASRSTRTEQIPNWRSGERDGAVGYRRTPRAVAEDVRFSGTSYPGEGPCNYHPGSYGLVEPLKNPNNGPDKVEHLEQDRAELLRKLEELTLIKDQLARSREMPDLTKERVPVDRRTIPLDPYVGHDPRFAESSSRQHRPSMQQPFPVDKHTQRPIYSNHGLEPMPLMNRHGMDMQNFYPPLMHASNEIPGYGDPFLPPMFGSNKSPHQYQQHLSHDYYSAKYMDMDSIPDHNASYPTNTFFHQPACSCVQCYNKNLHASAQVPPGVLQNRRFPDAPNNPMFYHAENRGAFVPPRGYHPRDPNLPLLRRGPQPRRPRDLDSETSSLGQNRPRRVLPVKRSGRRCCPVAGGAPFITCHNCFELLPLPRKLLLMEKNYRKLRCGACSTVMLLLFESKTIIVSIPAETKAVSPVVDNHPAVFVKDENLHSHGQANHQAVAYSSDYDSSGYNFQMTDTEPGYSSMDRRLNFSESEKMQSLVSSCSNTSEDEESPNSVFDRRETSNSAEPPLKAKGTPKGTPPFPGSPLREHPSSNQVVGKFEKGNRSKRINQEEVVHAKITSRQNSVKDVSVATEMDVSFNEYSNPGTSGEVSKGDHPRGKGNESIFGIIKKGFRDISKSHHTAENDRSSSSITINGQPILEKLVKKAEKYAGTIHPGHYWYDRQAGFWGVMGQPCLGIITPFIEEFDFPMPGNCAGGNTGVFVNGRELHQKDLNLLANRGLPTTPDKSYTIEISGRVVDDDTEEELDNLGKLAPTVEKLKRGFGMRVPRSAV